MTSFGGGGELGRWFGQSVVLVAGESVGGVELVERGIPGDVCPITLKGSKDTFKIPGRVLTPNIKGKQPTTKLGGNK